MLYLSYKEQKTSGGFNPGCFLLYKKFSTAIVLLTALVVYMLPCKLHAQDTSNILPDGTNGIYFNPRNADSEFVHNKQDLAPNEFVGTVGNLQN